MLAPNSILQNRYRIIRQLGQGGMGAVYEAIDQRVRSLVALKETLIGADTEAHSAFQREAALLANLRHPALPKVMDYFSENEGEFLVMEYVPGTDLAALLESRGRPFPQTRVLGWAGNILSLLEYLHSREPPILHRDIKPSNLKVTESGEIFLLDFGLAKGAAGQMHTLVASQSVRGYTPAYSPIEQIAGKGTDPRSDLYSLGATMYQLLTGRPPHDAPTRFAAIEEDQADPIVPVNYVNAAVSAELAQVIGLAMSISRRDRFATARAMRLALEGAATEIKKAGEAKTLVPEIDPASAMASPVTEAFIETPEQPRERPLATIPTSPLSPRPAAAVGTLPANQFLRRESIPNPVAVTEPTLATHPSNRRAGTIGVVVVVSLMLMGAMIILVWLLLRGTQTGSVNPQPAGPEVTAQSESNVPPPASAKQHEGIVANVNRFAHQIAFHQHRSRLALFESFLIDCRRVGNSLRCAGPMWSSKFRL